MDNRANSSLRVVGIIVGLALLFAGLYNASDREQSNHFDAAGEPPVERTIVEPYEMFYEKNNFTEALLEVEDIPPESDVRMVVVPHHLLVSHFIAEPLQRASGRPINTVFIIGPNHRNLGTTKITSAHMTWDTPIGVVQTHNTLTELFLESFGLTHDPEPFAIEHSIGAIVPFVHHYFPTAEVVPVIVADTGDITDVAKLNTWVQEHLPEDSLIIVSADFSHYHPKDVADQKDELTESLIHARDVEQIVRLDNTDYVDFPVGLALAMQYAKDAGLKTNILHHDNSFTFDTIKIAETTSYFVMTFTDE